MWWCSLSCSTRELAIFLCKRLRTSSPHKNLSPNGSRKKLDVWTLCPRPPGKWSYDAQVTQVGICNYFFILTYSQRAQIRELPGYPDLAVAQWIRENDFAVRFVFFFLNGFLTVTFASSASLQYSTQHKCAGHQTISNQQCWRLNDTPRVRVQGYNLYFSCHANDALGHSLWQRTR